MSEYIDKQKLKAHYAWWQNEEQRDFDAIVDAQPIADVQEVRHGRWVAESYYAGPLKMWGWKCTACEAFSPVSQVKFYKFCPGCGAKMDGKKDNG